MKNKERINELRDDMNEDIEAVHERINTLELAIKELAAFNKATREAVFNHIGEPDKMVDKLKIELADMILDKIWGGEITSMTYGVPNCISSTLVPFHLDKINELIKAIKDNNVQNK